MRIAERCDPGRYSFAPSGGISGKGNVGGRYFGTDGIRGRANTHPMTPDVAMRVGMAVGLHYRNGHRQSVVIGKDTRRSGYLIENALTAGFLAVGVDVFLLGPIPTPAVAMLTRSLRADYGVMISASHNPFEDNGIKLFDPDGFKLSRRGRGADRGADRLRHEQAACHCRSARAGQAHRRRARALRRGGETNAAAADELRRAAGSWSTARTAPATRLRRWRSKSSARRWSNSASSRMA